MSVSGLAASGLRASMPITRMFTRVLPSHASGMLKVSSGGVVAVGVAWVQRWRSDQPVGSFKSGAPPGLNMVAVAMKLLVKRNRR